MSGLGWADDWNRRTEVQGTGTERTSPWSSGKTFIAEAGGFYGLHRSLLGESILEVCSSALCLVMSRLILRVMEYC